MECDIIVHDIDNVYIKIETDNSVKQELSEFFSFAIPNAQFNPKVKKKVWDGKIRLFDKRTNKIYKGLLEHIRWFAKDRSYTIHIDPNCFPDIKNNINKKTLIQFIDSINIPKDYEKRDYQLDYILDAIKAERRTLLSPTRSGKSLMIYILHRALFSKKTLIVVPTIGLIEQMRGDFVDYGYSDDDIGIIMSGYDKKITKKITLSTWQSIYKFPESFYNGVDILVGDEAHGWTGESVKSIGERCNAKYRFGTTGTINDEDSNVNKLVIEGIFGLVRKFVTTKDLIDQGHVSDLLVNCITLEYSDSERKKRDYHDEMEFLCTHEKRNNYIANLAIGCKKTTLVLFNYQEHGELLHKLIKSKTDRPVLLVHGGIDKNIREEIRQFAIANDDSIVVASYGTFSTGITIPNLYNVIFASPFKSMIRNLQSIGRSIGKYKDKIATIYDISDNLMKGDKPNHGMVWFSKRIVRYIKEQFNYKIYKVKI